MRYFSVITNAIRNFDFYSARAINSFKTAVACLLGLAIIDYFAIPMGQWTLVTIIVIMSAQTRLGGALQRAYARTAGTLAGATVATLAVLLFDHNIWALSIVIFLSTLFFSYIATSSISISNAGTLGAVTVALTLVTPHPGFTYVIQRIVEILGGIAIALLVSIFLFPIYARKTLLHNFANSCQKIADFYQATLYPSNELPAEKNPLLEDEIIQIFSTQRQLIKETETEQRKKRQQSDSFKQIINCEREIFHAILLMNNSLNHSPDIHLFIKKIEPLNAFHQNVIVQLEQLTQIFKQQRSTFDLTATNAALQATETIINTTSLQQTLPVIINVHSYLFGAKLIVQNMQEFYTLALQITRQAAKNQGKMKR